MVAENHLLNLLDKPTRALLKPVMKVITVTHGDVLHGASSVIEYSYFPRSTIISVLARTEHGQTAETSIVGREGMIASAPPHGQPVAAPAIRYACVSSRFGCAKE